MSKRQKKYVRLLESVNSTFLSSLPGALSVRFGKYLGLYEVIKQDRDGSDGGKNHDGDDDGDGRGGGGDDNDDDDDDDDDG